MKVVIISVVLGLILFSSSGLYACPTCVGAVEPHSPPFFMKYYDTAPEAQEEKSIVTEGTDDTKKELV